MQKTLVKRPEIKLIGITCRTQNSAEMDPTTAKIGPTIQHYFQNTLPSKIPNPKKPSITYCVYTEYESDFTGAYTYFIGEEVTSLDDVPEGFSSLIIPAQNYVVFTNQPGAMPAVCIDMWQKIWTMTAADFGGERAYRADFEIYDQRASDPHNTVLDIFIGLREM